MNILWLCSWYPNSADPFDGDFVERQAKALAQHHPVHVIHIVQNKHFLKQITKLKKEERSSTNLKAEIYFLPLPNSKFGFLNLYLFNKNYQKLYKKLIQQYIKKNNKPDIIHVQVPIKAGLTASWIKNKYNIPYVVTEHSSAYFKHIPENYFNQNNYFKFVTKHTFRNAIAVSSVSKWLLNRLQGLFTIQKTKLIYNVADTNLFYPVLNKKKKIRFIHVSMMHPLKNITGILQALALLKQKSINWEFWFIGPASKASILLSETLGLKDCVIWRGVLAYNQVAEDMRSADALVHFSNYENMPCVISEAQCCGLPVISSNVGGIAELVNSSNGILVTAGKENELADAMNEYIRTINTYNKNEIAEKARSIFNEKVIGLQLKNWYEELLTKK